MSDTSVHKQVIIVGAGMGGLCLATLLAKAGYQVTIYEKNESYGGRGRVFETDGYVFDMGPSWYMMPEVFEDFFAILGEDIHTYLELQKLSPSYRVFYEAEGNKPYDFFADREKMRAFFEEREPGAGEKLVRYLDESARQYAIAKKEFMYKNYNSIFDLFNLRVMKEGRKLEIFKTMDTIINRLFTDDLLRKVMKYQMVLLGTAPHHAPGIYRLMNHVDFDLGIWYPKGGIGKLFTALYDLAQKHGVVFYFNTPVEQILVHEGVACGVRVGGREVPADIVVSNADLHYTDTTLVPREYAERTEEYWRTKTMAPSALILYLGLNKKMSSLVHHNLFFSTDWDTNFKQIIDYDRFPDNPSMYVSCPSYTDPTIAPVGHENVFVLVPISSGVSYTEAELARWTDYTLQALEEKMGCTDLRQHIEYRRVYCVKDFEKDYFAYKGSALGMAHTLLQSAFWRPNNMSKTVQNLYYVGANNNPGIGMPICLMSAETVYKRIAGITSPEPLPPFNAK